MNDDKKAYWSKKAKRGGKIPAAVKPIEQTEAELRQLFENNSNCYADTLDGEVVLAMDADRFVEVVKKLLN